MIMAAGDGLWVANTPPAPPSLVGGDLPQSAGGNVDGYYWPNTYPASMTYKYRNLPAPPMAAPKTGAAASSSSASGSQAPAAAPPPSPQ